MGLQKVNNMIEYTNRGVGMTKVPFRFGSRPEITVFTLKTASKS
jgi:predicted MPP superfamily phosphohydrolase